MHVENICILCFINKGQVFKKKYNTEDAPWCLVELVEFTVSFFQKKGATIKSAP